MHHYTKITKHKNIHTDASLQQDNQTQTTTHIHNYAPLQQDNQTQATTHTYS